MDSYNKKTDLFSKFYLLHLNSLVQHYSNSSALAMELLQSCTELSI